MVERKKRSRQTRSREEMNSICRKKRRRLARNMEKRRVTRDHLDIHAQNERVEEEREEKRTKGERNKDTHHTRIRLSMCTHRHVKKKG